MRKLCAVLVLLSCGAASAADIDEQKLLATRLADLLTPKPADRASAACAPPPQALAHSLVESYTANPDPFYGISPQSAYWPEVEQAWRAFFLAMCAEEPPDLSRDVMVDAYAARLTAAQLREAIAFHGSATARAMLDAHAQIARGLVDQSKKDVQRGPGNAAVVFASAMRQLKEKYRADPR